jgi:hypothetical protein
MREKPQSLLGVTTPPPALAEARNGMKPSAAGGAVPLTKAPSAPSLGQAAGVGFGAATSPPQLGRYVARAKQRAGYSVPPLDDGPSENSAEPIGAAVPTKPPGKPQPLVAIPTGQAPPAKGVSFDADAVPPASGRATDAAAVTAAGSGPAPIQPMPPAGPRSTDAPTRPAAAGRRYVAHAAAPSSSAAAAAAAEPVAPVHAPLRRGPGSGPLGLAHAHANLGERGMRERAGAGLEPIAEEKAKPSAAVQAAAQALAGRYGYGESACLRRCRAITHRLNLQHADLKEVPSVGLPARVDRLEDKVAPPPRLGYHYSAAAAAAVYPLHPAQRAAIISAAAGAAPTSFGLYAVPRKVSGRP